MHKQENAFLLPFNHNRMSPSFKPSQEGKGASCVIIINNYLIFTFVKEKHQRMAVDLGKVATVELIREIERRVRCSEIKEEK